MNSILENSGRHSRNLAYLGVAIGIGIPLLVEVISVSMQTFRAMFFQTLFVIYFISIPLGFMIFLYALILRQKLNLNKWYWWLLAIGWFLGAGFFFLNTFSRL
ncbi:MAG: hypothetical protein JWM39_734 [Parcubacteria group bacterium]|nr:hypothetical protein [Parcubacteria group bacterium]